MPLFRSFFNAANTMIILVVHYFDVVRLCVKMIMITMTTVFSCCEQSLSLFLSLSIFLSLPQDTIV